MRQVHGLLTCLAREQYTDAARLLSEVICKITGIESDYRLARLDSYASYLYQFMYDILRGKSANVYVNLISYSVCSYLDSSDMPYLRMSCSDDDNNQRFITFEIGRCDEYPRFVSAWNERISPFVQTTPKSLCLLLDKNEMKKSVEQRSLNLYRATIFSLFVLSVIVNLAVKYELEGIFLVMVFISLNFLSSLANYRYLIRRAFLVLGLLSLLVFVSWAPLYAFFVFIAFFPYLFFALFFMTYLSYFK